MKMYKVVDLAWMTIGIFLMEEDAKKCAEAHHESNVVCIEVDADFMYSWLTY